MCIRDSHVADLGRELLALRVGQRQRDVAQREPLQALVVDPCLLYTSDAADERSSVDLGGRRIIKKKKQYKQTLVQ